MLILCFYITNCFGSTCSIARYSSALCRYRNIPIVIPGLKIFSKGFFAGLIFGELIIGRNFAFQNGLGQMGSWLGLNKNSLKHYENSLQQLKTANNNSTWAYIRQSLLSEGVLRLRSSWGGGGGGYFHFLGAYYRNFTICV